MANMTDRNTGGNNFVNKLLQAFYTSSTAFTITPGTGGGSAFTITPPFFLLLMTAQGSDTANGTQNTAGNSPGYTTGGKTLGATFCAAPTAGVSTNSNQVQWTATGTWTAGVASIEIWDSAPLRFLQGALTVAIIANAVTNGDTITFAASSITVDASAW